jgi:hypothetical protein
MQKLLSHNPSKFSWSVVVTGQNPLLPFMGIFLFLLEKEENN